MRQEELRGRFVYDADCGICTKGSLAFTRHWSNADYGIVSHQSLGAQGCAELGFTPSEAQQAAYWVSPGRAPVRGHAAVAAALKACGGWRWVLGGIIDAPVIRSASRAVYGFVAANRHRLPGPDACVVPSASPIASPTSEP